MKKLQTARQKSMEADVEDARCEACRKSAMSKVQRVPEIDSACAYLFSASKRGVLLHVFWLKQYCQCTPLHLRMCTSATAQKCNETCVIQVPQIKQTIVLFAEYFELGKEVSDGFGQPPSSRAPNSPPGSGAHRRGRGAGRPLLALRPADARHEVRARPGALRSRRRGRLAVAAAAVASCRALLPRPRRPVAKYCGTTCFTLSSIKHPMTVVNVSIVSPQVPPPLMTKDYSRSLHATYIMQGAMRCRWPKTCAG